MQGCNGIPAKDGLLVTRPLLDGEFANSLQSSRHGLSFRLNLYHICSQIQDAQPKSKALPDA